MFELCRKLVLENCLVFSARMLLLYHRKAATRPTYPAKSCNSVDRRAVQLTFFSAASHFVILLQIDAIHRTMLIL